MFDINCGNKIAIEKVMNSIAPVELVAENALKKTTTTRSTRRNVHSTTASKHKILGRQFSLLPSKVDGPAKKLRNSAKTSAPPSLSISNNQMSLSPTIERIVQDRKTNVKKTEPRLAKQSVQLKSEEISIEDPTDDSIDNNSCIEDEMDLLMNDDDHDHLETEDSEDSEEEEESINEKPIFVVPTADQKRESRSWIHKYRQLAHRFRILEREPFRGFEIGVGQQAGCLRELGREFLEISRDQEQDRLIDMKVLCEQSQDLARGLDIVRDTLEAYERDETTRDTVLAVTNEFEGALDCRRDQERRVINQCLREERQVERELEQFEAQMQSWERLKKSSSTSRIMRTTSERKPAPIPDPEVSQTNKKRSFLNDIAAINTKIQAHFAHNSWTAEEDQALLRNLKSSGCTNDFLLSEANVATVESESTTNVRRHRAESRVAQAIAQMCQHDLSHKSPAEVREQIHWLVRHLRLTLEKKQVIATWKLEKRQQDDVAEIMTTEEPTAGAPSREEQRALDQAKREAQEHKKLAIIAWKKEKQHQLQQEAEESKARQAEVEARKAQEQLYRVEMKQKVALYRLQKQQQDVAKKDLKQYTKKAVDISKNTLHELSSRAIEDAIQKRELQKKLNPPKNNYNYVKTADTRPSDPTRVYAPTQASKASAISISSRVKDEERRKAQMAHATYIPGGKSAKLAKAKSYGHVSVQARATPQWRKQLLG